MGSKIGVIGGGNIGFSLAQLIEKSDKNINTSLIENDKDRAEYLASQLQNITVTNGDGLDSQILEEVNIAEAGYFISVTEDDEVNILSSLLAKRAGAKVIVDNVFASPILQKPLELGADIVMYSATKHIDGQGRVLGGAILGSKKFCNNVIKPFIRNTGPSISPFNAWVLLKSMDTLDLRVKKQLSNTLEILRFLEKNNKVAKVLYPFSKSFKQEKLAKKQMKGGGTIISFELKIENKDKKKEETFKMLNKLKLIDISNNLGDTKTLITHPSTTTHHRLSKNEKNCLRITENLLRLSVGLEEPIDIISDLKQALMK